MSDYKVLFIALTMLVVMPVALGAIGSFLGESVSNTDQPTGFFGAIITFLDGLGSFDILGQTITIFETPTQFLKDYIINISVFPPAINFLIWGVWALILTFIVVKHLPTT